jgi:hypothetical protein
MIGLVLLYFAGKAFYNLAGEHGKSKWGFAILGVLSYYGGLFLGGIAIALFYEFALSKSIDEVNDTLLGLMAIPIGILVCWAFYRILKAMWSNSDSNLDSSEILDAELHRPENQQ